MQHAVVVIGTRPEAIKLAPVVFALRASSCFRTSVCSTGQHKEMLNDALGFFDLRPEHQLDVMRHDQRLAETTARMVSALDALFSGMAPDLVVVQGDTTTTFAAALAAFYNRIPVAHIEAGLRTANRFSPFPEEVNRVLTTHLADHHFAPTTRAEANLLREGVSRDRIHVVGNTVIDALQWATRKIGDSTPDALHEALATIDYSRRIVLVTGHRRESFGEPIQRICRALRTIASEPDIQVVYPVHMNPNVQSAVRAALGGNPNILLLPPVSYPAMVFLLAKATIVVTDSGGIQEEAPALGKPVLVTRDTTERPEAIEAGVAKLVGTSEERIVLEARTLLRDPAAYGTMAVKKSPYGDGHAAARIVRILAEGAA